MGESYLVKSTSSYKKTRGKHVQRVKVQAHNKILKYHDINLLSNKKHES